MKNKPKLKECPFCPDGIGKLVISEPYETETQTLIDVYVVCSDCGASTQISECELYVDIEDVSRTVIRKWNSRKNKTNQ